MAALAYDRLIALSLIESINLGRGWSPAFFKEFLTRVAHGPAPAALTTTNLSDQSEVSRLAQAALSGATNAVTRPPLPASTLRNILRCCEDDDSRHSCKEKPACGDNASEDDAVCNLSASVIVTRFGVQIEAATIDGYLNLSGFKFERPLVFKKCTFTHSLNLANARLGPLLIEDCEFKEWDKTKNDGEGGYDKVESKTTGYMPKLMKAAPGVNAFGAQFLGDVHIMELKAFRLDFHRCKISGVVILSEVAIKLPDFGLEQFREIQPSAQQRRRFKDLVAIDLAGASASRLEVRGDDNRPTRLVGALALNNGHFGSIALRGCSILAKKLDDRITQARKGCHWRSINADGLVVDTEFEISSLGSEANCPLPTLLFGQVWLDNARIGGTFSISGAKMFTGLSKGLRKRVDNNSPLGRSLKEYPMREATRELSLWGATVGGTLWFKGRDGESKASGWKIPKQAGFGFLERQAPVVEAEGRALSVGRQISRFWAARLATKQTVTSARLDIDPEQFGWESALFQKALDIESFVCDGEIDGRNLQVGGDLRVEQSLLTNQALYREKAIDFRRADIRGTLLFKDLNYQSYGDIDLREAKTGVYRDDFDYRDDQPLFRRVDKALILFWTFAAGPIFAAALFVLFFQPEDLSADANFMLRQFDSILRLLESRLSAFILSLVALIARVTQISPIWLFVFGLMYVLARTWGIRLYRTAHRYLLDQLPRLPKGPRDISRNPSQGGWPSRLRFALPGFVYASFPVREDRSRGTSDDARMPLAGGARIRWLKHQGDAWLSEHFQPQPWAYCAKVLREMGFDDEAHKILLRRETFALQSKSIALPEKISRWFLLKLCGHGHAMHRLVLLTVATLAVGYANNTIAFNANLVRPTNAQLLVDKDYKKSGTVPIDYSSFNPLPYSAGQLIPLPVLAGRGEWAACNRSQIEAAMSLSSPGACVPKTCNFRKPQRRDPACPEAECKSLEPLQGDWNEKTPKVFAIVEQSCGINATIDKALGIKAGAFRDRLNAWYSRGLAPRVNYVIVMIGWTISILVGAFALGTLKRNE